MRIQSLSLELWCKMSQDQIYILPFAVSSDKVGSHLGISPEPGNIERRMDLVLFMHRILVIYCQEET